jgi:internalin A
MYNLLLLHDMKIMYHEYSLQYFTSLRSIMSKVPQWLQQEIDRVRKNNLTELNLSRKRNSGLPALQFLPESIFELTQLKILNVDNQFLQEIPAALQNLNQLTYLSLSGQFTTIPKGIEYLTQLTHLELSGPFKNFPEQIAHLSQLNYLDLDGYFDTIPSGIEYLTQLTHLGLSGPFRNFPEQIAHLSQLNHLVIHGQFDTIPDQIGELSQLIRLSLSGPFRNFPEQIARLSQLNHLIIHSQFDTIPDQIGELSQLTQLKLRGQYTIIPDAISRLNQLSQLELRGQYTIIPDALTDLDKLTQLMLSGRFTSIPEEISNLTHLTHLVLRGEYIIIREGIIQLTQLIQLVLRGQYYTIPEGICDLTQLIQLVLHGEYEIIPEEITSLTQLTQLELAGQFINIPEGIYQLRQLSRLVLRGHITAIPTAIFELPLLSHLDLDGNRIRTVPREILNLNQLTYLSLRRNPVEIPPFEIAQNNLQAVRDYYESLQEESEDHLYEAKLLIIGESGAGKTTLAKKILDPRYRLIQDENSTEGIGVMQWSFPLDNGQLFRVNIWDFGGQEIYHATHQFFLTNRSLYVVVADSRKEDTDFNYWLNVVELLGGDSPILVIKNEKQNRQRQIGEPQLRKRFPNLAEILAVNLETNRGLQRVTDEITHRMRYLPHVGTPLPQSWVAVRKALEDDKRNYIRIEDYYRICAEYNLNDRSKQETVIDYLHDLGVCLHFKNDAILKHYVILKTHWGTSAVYMVLDNKAVIGNFGRFTRQQLDQIWQHVSYRGMHDELLRLMMRFKLCYEIPGLEDSYIAPQLLSEDQPKYEWNDLDNLYLRFKYDFMPKGLVTRLIVAMHRYIVDNMVWKTGVIFESNMTTVEVIEYYQNRSIHIRVEGNDKKGLLAVIIHKMDEIHSNYPGLKVDVLVPCNCAKCAKAIEPYFFEYDVLQRSLSYTEEVQCQHSFVSVNTRRLLDNALPRRFEIGKTEDDLPSVIVNNYGTYMDNRQGGIGSMEQNTNKSEAEFNGDFQAGNANFGGKQTFGDNAHIEFNYGSLKNAAEDSQLAELRELLKQLEAELKKVPVEQSEDAEIVQDLANAAAEEAGKEKPSAKRLEITADGLKKAAENLLGVAPIAMRIAAILTGIG